MTESQTTRTFPTSAAERFDRSLRRSLALNPLPKGITAPKLSCEWPAENVSLLEKYRDWLVAGGTSDSVINHHRIPVAGTMLGLALKPLAQLCLDTDKDKTLAYIKAKKKGAMWERNCTHSLRWFCTFLEQEMGLPHWNKPKTYGDEERFKAGLPDWLLTMLTKQLRLLQGNWRKSRQAEMTYQFWYKYAHTWRWLFEQGDIEKASEIKRSHIYDYIDAMLLAGYAPKTVNIYLHSFQATLRYMDEVGVEINRRLLMIQGLKVDDPLPRFLNDEQVAKVREGLDERVAQAQTHVQKRDCQLNRAMFTLLWQTGMRVSELEDLLLDDLDLNERKVTIRQAKWLKDRVVYLTDTVVKVLTAYLEVRGPALSDHVFIYRHKMVSKDLVRLRVKAAGKRIGVYVTPHMLRHTFATQLLNSGCKVTSIQILLGHKRLNTTMVYARVHDETLVKDYYQAMAKIEGDDSGSAIDPQALLAKLENGQLDEQQRQALESLRQCLS